MDDAMQDDAILHPSEAQIRGDLLAARADIAAGRVVSGDVVLAEMQRRIDDYLKKHPVQNGNPIG